MKMWIENEDGHPPLFYFHFFFFFFFFGLKNYVFNRFIFFFIMIDIYRYLIGTDMAPNRIYQNF